MARGVNTLADSLDFYVQARDVALLAVTATATSTQSGADQTNTLHKGIILNPIFTTISATCTVRVMVQGKDSLSGLYYAITSLSLDGLTTGNVTATLGNMNPVAIYPGITVTPSVGQSVNYILPQVFRVIASITGATTSLAAVSFAVNGSKIL